MPAQGDHTDSEKDAENQAEVGSMQIWNTVWKTARKQAV